MVHIPPHAPISRAGPKAVSLTTCLSDTAHMIHIYSVGLELAEDLLGIVFSRTMKKRNSCFG